MSEVIHLKPAQKDAPCDIHDWEDHGIALRLVAAMRECHGKGGVNACRPCLDRVYADRDAKRRVMASVDLTTVGRTSRDVVQARED